MIAVTAGYPDVPTALAALGDDRDAVADSLARGGFTGEPNEPDACPIKAYLATAVTGLKWLSIGSSVAEFQAGGEARTRIVALPDPVRAFITAFDSLVYPRLVTYRRRPEPVPVPTRVPPVPPALRGLLMDLTNWATDRLNDGYDRQYIAEHVTETLAALLDGEDLPTAPF